MWTTSRIIIVLYYNNKKVLQILYKAFIRELCYTSTTQLDALFN